MKRILILILLFLLIITTGCQFRKEDKLYLEDLQYGKGTFIDIKAEDIEKLNKKDTTYIVFAYNNFCTLPISCESIFKEFMEKYNISLYYIPFSEFKKTYLYETIKYAPTIIIINNGEIVDYLDANSDEDYDKYQKTDEFTKWIKEYVYLKK